MPRIFVSYSRADQVFARRLASSLSNLGADVWIDVDDIPAGMKWSSAIQQGLDTGELLMVIISPESMASRNVEDEWQYYLDQKKPIIPIFLHPAKIHFQLNRIQYIDFHNQSYDAALEDLHAELRRNGVHLRPIAAVRATIEAPAPRPARAARSSRRWGIGALIGIVAILLVGVALLGLFRPADDVPATPASETPFSAAPTPTDEILFTPVAAVPLGFAGNPVTRNQDWSSFVHQTFNGVEMELVPAGCFMMGSTDAQIDAALQQCEAVLPGQCSRASYEDEAPQTRVCFEQPFWIGRTEVTNGIYGAPGIFPGDDMPRTNVTWHDAELFCESRGGRLPTEAEWEYAARGPDGLVYPWGNDFDGTRVNTCDGSCNQDWKTTAYDDNYADAMPVGAYSTNYSWVGSLDIIGNVWEWTSTIYHPYPYDQHDGRENLGDTESKRVLRGGSWNWIAADARAAARDDYAGNLTSSDFYGFRCARDFQPADLG